MKYKKIIAMTVAASALCWASGASADVLLGPGPFKMKFSNFEDFIPGVGSSAATPLNPGGINQSPGVPNGVFQDGNQDLRGTFNITTVETTAGSTSFPDVAISGKQTAPGALTGLFSGFDLLYAVGNPFTGGQDFGYTGGVLNIYQSTSNTPDFTQGPGGFNSTSTAYSSISNGSLWLSAKFVPGNSTTNAAATLYGSNSPIKIDDPTDPTGYLHVDSSGNCSTGFPGNVDPSTGTNYCVAIDGNATSYLQITGGSAASRFTKNSFGTGRDLRLGNHFGSEGNGNFLQTGFNWGWNISSDDPATGTIPEPGTVALMAVAMGGLAGTLRRSSKKKGVKKA